MMNIVREQQAHQLARGLLLLFALLLTGERGGAALAVVVSGRRL